MRAVGDFVGQEAASLLDVVSKVAASTLVLDMSGVERIDEDGVGALIRLRQRLESQDRALTIEAPSAAVVQQLELRGLVDFLGAEWERAVEPPTVLRLIGVYNADGTARGELTYWVMARLGRAHCALCTITHGSVRERGDWRSARSTLPVPFDTYHRDDQPNSVAVACRGAVPVVVAETTSEFVELLGPAELDAIAGSPTGLVDAISSRIVERSLRWPAPARHG